MAEGYSAGIHLGKYSAAAAAAIVVAVDVMAVAAVSG